MNDVRVIGLIWNTNVVIADIGESVPHGVTVTIPAKKAERSKDLWRLLSQKQLFRLNPGGPLPDLPPGTVAPPPPDDKEAERLREQVRQLDEQNRLLKQTLASQGGKLDTILGFLEKGLVPVAAGGTAPVAAVRDTGVVDAGVPKYIPSEIKPQNVESHVEVQKETSEGNGVSGAGAALRALKKQRAR
jgi:hypothetical protein